MIQKKERFEILDKLGPVPFWRGERKALAALEEIYSRAASKAARTLEKLGEKRNDGQ